MAENTTTLTLYLAGGACKDLYPYEIELEEGLSQLYRGRLTALSGTFHTAEELSELLDQKVSLSITQRLADDRTHRTRWLHGILSAVECNGVIVGANKQDCYRTVLTIEPELARLRHTLRTESFYRVNPVDVAEAVLNHYGLKGSFTGNYIDRRKYGQHLMFEEINEPRLTFLDRLLRIYGLSYTFCHPKTGASRLMDAELYFSDGGRYPVSDVVYSDNRKVPAVGRFDFLGKDEGQNLWKMDNWRMESSIGVDGLGLSAAYPESFRENHEWRRGRTGEKDRYYNYTTHFHSYARETPEEEMDNDIKLILDARYLALQLAKSRWEGDAENLALVPGLVFELTHFYGRQHNSVITALVTAIKLRARMVWPPNLAAPSDAAGGECINVRAVCTDFGKDSQRRFVPKHL
ncbi:MAG: phage late control D family protein [Treponema sp.]|jgi:uncharacterized protein involved in type VI secretion and phage assembly|nr:phage late control D family protein [Treponema sp.]